MLGVVVRTVRTRPSAVNEILHVATGYEVDFVAVVARGGDGKERVREIGFGDGGSERGLGWATCVVVTLQ